MSNQRDLYEQQLQSKYVQAQIEKERQEKAKESKDQVEPEEQVRDLNKEIKELKRATKQSRDKAKDKKVERQLKQIKDTVKKIEKTKKNIEENLEARKRKEAEQVTSIGAPTPPHIAEREIRESLDRMEKVNLPKEGRVKISDLKAEEELGDPPEGYQYEDPKAVREYNRKVREYNKQVEDLKSQIKAGKIIYRTPDGYAVYDPNEISSYNKQVEEYNRKVSEVETILEEKDVFLSPSGKMVYFEPSPISEISEVERDPLTYGRRPKPDSIAGKLQEKYQSVLDRPSKVLTEEITTAQEIAREKKIEQGQALTEEEALRANLEGTLAYMGSWGLRAGRAYYEGLTFFVNPRAMGSTVSGIVQIARNPIVEGRKLVEYVKSDPLGVAIDLSAGYLGGATFERGISKAVDVATGTRIVEQRQLSQVAIKSKAKAIDEIGVDDIITSTTDDIAQVAQGKTPTVTELVFEPTVQTQRRRIPKEAIELFEEEAKATDELLGIAIEERAKAGYRVQLSPQEIEDLLKGKSVTRQTGVKAGMVEPPSRPSYAYVDDLTNIRGETPLQKIMPVEESDIFKELGAGSPYPSEPIAGYIDPYPDLYYRLKVTARSGEEYIDLTGATLPTEEVISLKGAELEDIVTSGSRVREKTPLKFEPPDETVKKYAGTGRPSEIPEPRPVSETTTKTVTRTSTPIRSITEVAPEATGYRYISGLLPSSRRPEPEFIERPVGIEVEIISPISTMDFTMIPRQDVRPEVSIEQVTPQLTKIEPKIRDKSKDIVKDISKDGIKDIVKTSPRQEPIETVKTIVKQIPKEQPRQITTEIPISTPRPPPTPPPRPPRPPLRNPLSQPKKKRKSRPRDLLGFEFRTHKLARLFEDDKKKKRFKL